MRISVQGRSELWNGVLYGKGLSCEDWPGAGIWNFSEWKRATKRRDRIPKVESIRGSERPTWPVIVWLHNCPGARGLDLEIQEAMTGGMTPCGYNLVGNWLEIFGADFHGSMLVNEIDGQNETEIVIFADQNSL
jgi:hypothetical protein